MTAKTKKILLLALVIAYVVSPADFMAGPFDDLFVMLLGALANSKLPGRRRIRQRRISA